MCEETWFVALAVFGVISIISILLYGLIAWFAWIFADREEANLHIPRNRKLFRGRFR